MLSSGNKDPLKCFGHNSVIIRHKEWIGKGQIPEILPLETYGFGFWFMALTLLINEYASDLMQ